MTESMLYFILGCSGLTIIVTISTLFEPVRNWFKCRVPFLYKVLSCPMCFGMWVGAIMLPLQGTIAYDLLCAGGMISLVSWVTVMKVK